MPIPSPFHPRTQALCETYKWKDWAGFYAVCTYTQSLDREYNAIRQGSALFDVTPLYKYDVTGPDAGAFLSRVFVRGVSKMKVGRMTYLCWCDDAGKVLDDGTCARLGPEHYRVTAAAPSYWWFVRQADGFDVEIADLTEKMGALALQGPTSRDLLKQVCDADMDGLRYFGVAEASFGDGVQGYVSRTGYTGDLGYELWVDNAGALHLWDRLMEAGRDYGIHPAGLDALDISRVEAGFIMNGVDYTSANVALVEHQKSTPYELGLDWCVKLERAPFIGQAALAREKAEGSQWAFVGLDIDWESTEALFAAEGLPPHVPPGAWRCAIPVYSGQRQVGRATSGAWSPMLKKNLALATVEARFAEPGTQLMIEQTVEWSRKTVPATVLPMPFFNPKRKRA